MSATIYRFPKTPPARTASLNKQLTIAVAGNPNAGKTSLFNALTGLRQKVANYPGVTVERKEGLWSLSPETPPARIIDLPGLYSLEATSLDEQIARDVLLGQGVIEKPDVVVVVVDATSLVRNLYLATQLLETGCPMVIALTMFDLAERNLVEINVEKLSAALGVPVIPVVARQERGLERLARAVFEVAAKTSAPRPVSAAPLTRPWQSGLESRRLQLVPITSSWNGKPNGEPESRKSNSLSWQLPLIERYRWIEKVVADAVVDAGRRQRTTERIDALATHKVLGPVILFLVMLLVFQTIFSWANLPMNLIDSVFNAIAAGVRAHLPAGLLTDLIVNGIIPGVGGVLIFLPQIMLLFFFITILEDSGYMARAAFLMDRLMRAVGLHGKAFVPLLSSFACAVPGIMATRTIENPKDRIATMMIAPFMSCSARLPVYTLMIAAFFSGRNLFGFISLGALIILGMYLLGILVAVIVSWLLKHTLLKAPSPPFVMELPPYRLPNLSNVGHSLMTRVGVFLKRAGTVILAISILLWALVAFPRATSQGASDTAAQVENSYAGQAGRIIEPLIKPLGFDWKIGIGLISSFAARETVISTLSIVYNVGEEGGPASSSLVEAIHNAKRPDGSPVWTPLVGLSLMVFFVLACQCMSTLAVVRRETNSWRWPLFMVSYMLVLAYVASLITFQGGRLLGFS
ncbi:MAG TPA: ferrous iron transport protein B [Pyrinomonadaceae bacterium]|nr:ferrous iron transport protein B [Pyrinomonadaceae bacterium]